MTAIENGTSFSAGLHDGGAALVLAGAALESLRTETTAEVRA